MKLPSAPSSILAPQQHGGHRPIPFGDDVELTGLRVVTAEQALAEFQVAIRSPSCPRRRGRPSRRTDGDAGAGRYDPVKVPERPPRRAGNFNTKFPLINRRHESGNRVFPKI